MKILCFILNFRFKWTTIQHFASCAEWRLFKLGFYCTAQAVIAQAVTAQAVLPMVRPVQRPQSWGGLRSQRRLKSLCPLVTRLLLWLEILPRLWWNPEWSVEFGSGSWQSCGLGEVHSLRTCGWWQDTPLAMGSTVGAGDPCRSKQKQRLSSLCLSL